MAEPRFDQKFSQQPRQIKDVAPIEEPRNISIKGRTEISRYVEAPLLTACEELWDKGIRTLSSSANQKDMQTGHGYIIIDFDNLSPENKEIASSFAQPMEYDEMQAVKIEIPLSEDPDAIKKAAEAIAHRFQTQPSRWIKGLTLDEIKNTYGVPLDDPDYDSESFIGSAEEGLWYYDK